MYDDNPDNWNRDTARHDRLALPKAERLAERHAFDQIVQPYSHSPVTGCPDCETPKHGTKVFCDWHRCRGVKASGERCKYAAQAGMDYCRLHGCKFSWHAAGPGTLGVNCLAACTRHNYCDEHQFYWERIWGWTQEPA